MKNSLFIKASSKDSLDNSAKFDQSSFLQNENSINRIKKEDLESLRRILDDE